MTISGFQLYDDGDFVVLYDGGDTQSPPILNVTNNDVGKQYNSSGTQLTIQMVSDGFGTSAGFLAEWATYSKISYAKIMSIRTIHKSDHFLSANLHFHNITIVKQI